MSSKSLKMSKRKEKNEQQKDESIDGVSEAYHEGDDDYVTKKDVYEVMKVQPTSVNNRSDGVIQDVTKLKSSIHITIIFCLVAFATSF